MSRFWRLLRSVKLFVSGPEKQYVGTDPFGNMYYRIPQHETWTGQIIKERRFMENVGMKEYQYEEGNIPIEWEAWIRKKRKDPPTIEEILKNLDYKDELKRKINELDENEKLLRAKDHEECAAEPLQIQVKGHASSHHYGKTDPSEEPVSTANTFQPGAWMPSQDSARNK